MKYVQKLVRRRPGSAFRLEHTVVHGKEKEIPISAVYCPPAQTSPFFLSRDTELPMNRPRHEIVKPACAIATFHSSSYII